jgi:hypothetical protein
MISQPYSYFSEIWVVCYKDTLPNMAQDVYNHLSEIVKPYISNYVAQQFPNCAQPNIERRTLPRLISAVSVIFANDNTNHSFKGKVVPVLN